MIVRIRRRAYERGWLRQRRLPKPVVSIGNITVGGTGKTPFVVWMAQYLHSKGIRVAILSRGYGRQGFSKNLLVSDGQGHVQDWRVAGDEPRMIAQQCPWAIVAVGSDRFRLGQWLLTQTSCDCFILDDGYQHLSLYRDLDVVLFDATDTEGLCGLLPAGRLREPLSATKEAGAFVFTRAESLSSIQPVRRQIEKSLGQSIIPIILQSVPKEVQHLVTGQTKPVKFLLEFPIIVVSGVGNPHSFREMVVKCGLEVCEEIRFPDHCAYGQQEVSMIREKMEQSEHKIVITTEKDAVKLREWFTKDDSVWFLTITLEFGVGEHHVLELLNDVGIP